MSCQQHPPTLFKIESKQIPITNRIKAVDSIDQFVKPYRNRIDEVLDSTLAYATATFSSKDGPLNTSAGNFMADIVISEAGPIFKKRTNNEIDFAILNRGGIRAEVSKGNVTARNMYQVMPFENTIVVVQLSAKSVRELIAFLIQAHQPHPMSGIQIKLDSKGSLYSVNIKGKPFDEDRSYFIATSNYLANGGDNMNFFKNNIGITETDYLLRNAMIDYISKMDTIIPLVDDRFVQAK
ncbi:5'-nucleotidase [Sediminicola arcticus]|jgi:2',3'-cyclic-nucleotide 2'-phosphodiesterase (5'-nucleotidase family)|uniref:5'-nucleotidase n=1 Tax=Sediminicola arcticus TaxID=1574308 RepID=A0ABV2ST88_9FLAO